MYLKGSDSIRTVKLELGYIIEVTTTKSCEVIKNNNKIKLAEYVGVKTNNSYLERCLLTDKIYICVMKVIKIIKPKFLIRILNWIMRKPNSTTFILEVVRV